MSKPFLNLYYKSRIETKTGVIYGLRQNGFLIYIPDLDLKCPVFLANRRGQVCLDPAVLNMKDKIINAYVERIMILTI